jgi:hypothetical protein
LGTWGDAKIRYFDGSIDEVRLWNFARTQAEVQADMRHELMGSESGLIAYYNFNQGASCGSNPTVTSLQDLTTNAFIGTLNNFKLNGQISNWICTDAGGATALQDSLQDSLQVEYFNLFPNPTSVNINIAMENEGLFLVQIFDLTGRLVIEHQNHDNKTPIELGQISNGLYIVILVGGSKNYIGKIVLQSQ